MDRVAKIKWNKENERYELYIGGKLKAYTQDDHEKGLEEMKRMVDEKGYMIIVEG